MPETDSAICAVTLPIRLRVSTSATCDVRWNQRVSDERRRHDREDDEPEPPVGDQERDRRAAGSRITFATSVGMPCERTSETASTSLVSRAMIQPAFCCEK